MKSPRLFAAVLLSAVAALSAEAQAVLAGTERGLFRLDAGRAVPLWQGGEVRKIVKAEDGWYLLSSAGVVFSADLSAFETRGAGLPVKTIKRYANGKKTFVKEPADLKDLELDPFVPGLAATCTKDEVFVTKDGGKTWASYGTPEWTSGMKAVCVVSAPKALVFASHPIRGVFSKPLGAPKAAWTRVPGFETVPTMSSPDEVSDLAVRAVDTGVELWAANSFLPRLYRYDWKSGAFAAAWSGPGDFAVVESLCPTSSGLVHLVDGEVRRLVTASGISSRDERAARLCALATSAAVGSGLGRLDALYAKAEGGYSELSLSELWLLDRATPRLGANELARVAHGRKGIYLRTDLALKPESWARYADLLAGRGLDMVTLDVKDDSGRLRFVPRDPYLTATARVGSTIDIDSFLKEMKKRKIATVARIVVFKDQTMYERKGGAYAVWDSANAKAWLGWLGDKDAAEADRKYMKEYWVDPYCEEIWAYNAAVANEAVARGFDEVQFDYIRFPTDGVNLGDASFRWRDAGMDKESALMSFLGYVRENVKAPIGIDIYGANGWYRSGVRTGQDVELLARYADVICPMFYPSHFEQDFLAHEPAVERPYRIYKLGTLRADAIGRGRVLIRPYVQAFNLGTSYDAAYYDASYVAREAAGVRDAGDPGLTYWNNSGRYDDIPLPELGEGPRPSQGY